MTTVFGQVMDSSRDLKKSPIFELLILSVLYEQSNNLSLLLQKQNDSMSFFLSIFIQCMVPVLSFSTLIV